MGIYTLALRTSSGTNATAALELRTAASPRIRILEVGIALAAATASTFGLGRPAAIGLTPTAPVTGLAIDPADTPGTVQAAVAWATGPAAPANFLRRFSMPAAIGNAVIWPFPPGQEIVVPASSSIVFWNLATNAVADIYVTWSE